ncbi:MAG: spore maturation protein [Bacilli bacterium]|nr:spore maturation protein [Bacilli bacterium]MDD4298757.1 spore maturation protein [Bacilli bacterium]MDD4644307.1 spore maturation protein [Bacilli bacterium]
MLISKLVMPSLVVIIIIYAFIKKVDIYDCFIKGAKEGVELAFNIFPYLLAMIFGINILIKSNIVNDFLFLLSPLFNFLKIPIEIIPMAVMRPVSGTATLALMNDIFTKYGVDSFLGRLASTIQGSTDTTIYILTLYFGIIGVKKIRYALWVGLIADLVGIIASIIAVNLIF